MVEVNGIGKEEEGIKVVLLASPPPFPLSPDIGEGTMSVGEAEEGGVVVDEASGVVETTGLPRPVSVASRDEVDTMKDLSVREAKTDDVAEGDCSPKVDDPAGRDVGSIVEEVQYRGVLVVD